MALNANQRAKLEEHLATTANGACQLCGATDWEIDDRSLYVSDSPTEMGMFAMRVAPVACKNCSQVVFFAANLLGI